jgi:hypothetical protein
MSDIRTRGTTDDLMVNLFVPDNSVITGAGVSGLTKDSTNLCVGVRRSLDAAETVYTGANLETQTTIGTYQAPSSSAKCRIKETGTGLGQYELQFHVDAGHFSAATAAKKLFVRMYEATTTALKIGPNTKEIQLVAFDLQNATPTTLISVGTGAGQINASSGKVPSTIAAGDLAANSLTASALATDAVTELINGLLNTINTATTFNTANSVGVQIRQGTSVTAFPTIYTGTARAGSTANTIVLPAAASAVNDVYDGATIVLTGGVGVGQTRRIVAYNGTTKVATVDKAWVTLPTATSTFNVLAGTSSIVAFEGVATAGGNSTVGLPTAAVATDDYYSGFVVIESGTGSGQSKQITGYTGASRQISIAPDTWSVNPSTDSVVAIIPAGSAAAQDAPPTAFEIASAVLDQVDGIETGLTLRQAHRLQSAAAAGKLSGANTTTVAIKNAVADSKPRITATVDAYGNRSAITTDVS